jgi:hypothetical protein
VKRLVPYWLVNWWRNRHIQAAGTPLVLPATAHDYAFGWRLAHRLDAVDRWRWRDETWEWVG